MANFEADVETWTSENSKFLKHTAIQRNQLEKSTEMLIEVRDVNINLCKDVKTLKENNKDLKFEKKTTAKNVWSC